ncbi:mycothiol synthase [Pseudonocardia eucalypti]|uniref:Mycothiol acetyltransferase n=1 Tax=Pseudonocardia eucalypti TaxID=648755 RepID=A0ABP9R0L6_9PSEU
MSAQVDAEQVQELLAAATAEDGTAPIGEGALLAPDAVHLFTIDDDRLTGYATLDLANPDEAVGELAVHPGARRQGIGRVLVNALIEQAKPRALRIWAHGEHPGAKALAQTLGFQQVRELWQMRRSLATPELPEVRLTEGVALRTFRPGRDESEFLRVNNAAFDWHPEQGGWSLDQVKQRENEPWFDPEGFFLAVEATDPDRLLGFHWTKVHTAPERIGADTRSADASLGEVYVVGVDPAQQGRKLGAALTLAGLRHLRDRGLSDVMLYVEADNAPAVRVYRNLGFEHYHTDAAFRHEP